VAQAGAALSPAHPRTPIHKAGFGPVTRTPRAVRHRAGPWAARWGCRRPTAGVANEDRPSPSAGWMSRSARVHAGRAHLRPVARRAAPTAPSPCSPNGSTVSFTSFTATTGVFSGIFKLAPSGVRPGARAHRDLLRSDRPVNDPGNAWLRLLPAAANPSAAETILTSPKLSGRVQNSSPCPFTPLSHVPITRCRPVFAPLLATAGTPANAIQTAAAKNPKAPVQATRQTSALAWLDARGGRHLATDRRGVFRRGSSRWPTAFAWHDEAFSWRQRLQRWLCAA